jgi:hypothetical protein
MIWQQKHVREIQANATLLTSSSVNLLTLVACWLSTIRRLIFFNSNPAAVLNFEETKWPYHEYCNLIGSQMSKRRKMNKTGGVLCSFRLKLREVLMEFRELTIWIFYLPGMSHLFFLADSVSISGRSLFSCLFSMEYSWPMGQRKVISTFPK